MDKILRNYFCMNFSYTATILQIISEKCAAAPDVFAFAEYFFVHSLNSSKNRPATTATRKVVSPSTLIGPFEFEFVLRLRVVLSARAQIQMDQSELKPPCERPLSRACTRASEESRRGEF